MSREPVDIWPMIDGIKQAVNKRLGEGLLRESDKFSPLRFYQMDSEERRMFIQRLNGFHIPATSFQLTWVDARHYFEVTTQAA